LMTNHIASTSRWRLRAGLLGHLAAQARDHLRLAFSGFITPELAAAAVRRSAQRPVALLPAPAPTVEPEIVGLPEGLPQAELRVAEPVTATPTAPAVEDAIEMPLPVQVLPGDQFGPIPRQGGAKRARLPAKTAEETAVELATAEPAAAFSPDRPKRGGQSAVPIAAGQPLAEPVSLRRTVSRQPRKGEAGRFAPKVAVPPSEPLVAEPVGALPTSDEVATVGRIEKPTPVDVVAPEVHTLTPRGRRGAAARALPQAGSEPTAAQSRDEPKPAGRARNKTPALVAPPQAQAAAAAWCRTGRKPRRAGEAVTADRASDSEGRFVNPSVAVR